MIRRINLFGGPCSGKSTAAASIYAMMKSQHHRVELVRENAKMWVYEHRPITKFDEMFLFAQAMRDEDLILRSGVDFIITDCPLMLIIQYTRGYDVRYWHDLVNIANEFEGSYPSANIMLSRPNMFVEDDRIHGLQESINIDNNIISILEEFGIEFESFSCANHLGIYDYIKPLLWSQK